MTNPMCRFIVIFKNIIFWHTKWIFLSSRLLGFTHSSLFQCIWNFQPHHSWFDSVSLLFILFSSHFFLLNFLFFCGGIFCPNVSKYQPPPIACNNNLRFSFGMGLLEILTGFFLILSWNEYTNDSVLINYVPLILSNNK